MSFEGVVSVALGFVSGHGFNRAVRQPLLSSALAAEVFGPQLAAAPSPLVRLSRGGIEVGALPSAEALGYHQPPASRAGSALFILHRSLEAGSQANAGSSGRLNRALRPRREAALFGHAADETICVAG